MTTRRLSRSSSRGGRARRKTTWDQSTINHTRGTAAGQSVTDISHPAIAANNEPTGTIRRWVGNWTLSPLTTGPAEYNVFIGIAVVTIDALAALAVPDPASDVTQDWYWWSAWEGGIADLGLSSRTMQFDIRTARRLREGYRLVLVSENLTQELASEFHLRARGLWSMP